MKFIIDMNSGTIFDIDTLVVVNMSDLPEKQQNIIGMNHVGDDVWEIGNEYGRPIDPKKL